MKRVGNLFPILISDENLEMAIKEVNRTHHWKSHHRPNVCTAWVEETMSERIAELRSILENGFIQKKPRMANRWDASARKWRNICEPIQWPDQYVHHALIQVIQPIMMRGMDHFCCGSIRGRGTHYAAKAIKRWMNKDYLGTKYCLCGDIRHFYDSLTSKTVMNRMRNLIKDYRILDLIERVISGGILIGAYTSQWFANTSLQPLDTMIRSSGLCNHYVRYMDNLTIFGGDKRKLRKLKNEINTWLNKHDLELKGDWQIFKVVRNEPKEKLPPPRNGVNRPKGRMVDAVGYRYGRGFSIPRKHTLHRLKRALAKYRKYKQGRKRVPNNMAAGLLSRLGQLRHCNNYNLYKMLYNGKSVTKELKKIVREAQKKEELTWNMYLERRKALRSLKQKEPNIAI